MSFILGSGEAFEDFDQDKKDEIDIFKPDPTFLRKANKGGKMTFRQLMDEIRGKKEKRRLEQKERFEQKEVIVFIKKQFNRPSLYKEVIIRARKK